MEIPSLAHFAIYEANWLQDHKYFMGVDNNRPVDWDEAVNHFIKSRDYDGFSIEEKCRMSYANEIVIPTLMAGEASEKWAEWIHSRLEDLCTLLNEHNLIKSYEEAA